MPAESVGPLDPTAQLGVGALVFDMTRNRLAILMDPGETWADGRYALRPPGGGVEWPAWRSDIRPATLADRPEPDERRDPDPAGVPLEPGNAEPGPRRLIHD
ncbi:hypothetical protein AB0O01_17365 [Streptomyces sp. NPDC093252]|uniref:hypothetical protein n=1 Tax=Streptomyces sp. NPDC093252 TaxID=3154980 RepID=UPI003429858B